MTSATHSLFALASPATIEQLSLSGTSGDNWAAIAGVALLLVASGLLGLRHIRRTHKK